MKPTHSWLTAADAARTLNVSRATLYAYVSRGRIRSQATAGPSRERRYAREDVERLRRKTEERRSPDKATAAALAWGLPVLESAITLIDGQQLYYRGHDAVQLSQSRSIADVASLIWRGQFADASTTAAGAGAPQRGSAAVRRPAGRPRARAHADLTFAARAQSMLAAAAADDPLAFDLRPGAVADTGSRILSLLTVAAAGEARKAEPIEQTLARAWTVRAGGAEVLRRTLILCADHELNVSAFTARCVASAGSHPYAVVIAGLAALEGTKHGGVGARVEAMVDSLRRARPLRKALADRVRRGDPIDGFGHPLYHDGDPRATALLDLLRDRYPRSPELAFIVEVAAAGSAATGEHPNLDFALAAVTRVLDLPAGSPLTLFALGRTIGWIGHAIEQYATGQLIRPRAKYTGMTPR